MLRLLPRLPFLFTVLLFPVGLRGQDAAESAATAENRASEPLLEAAVQSPTAGVSEAEGIESAGSQTEGAAKSEPKPRQDAEVTGDPQETGGSETVGGLQPAGGSRPAGGSQPAGGFGSPAEPPEEYRVEFQRRCSVFEDCRQRLQIALGDQREVYTRFLNGEDRSPAAKQAFYDRRERVRELLDETYLAALDVVRMGGHEEAATFLVTMVQHRVERDIYNETTLEGAARLIDGGSRLTFLFQAAARSAVVEGEFDMAKRLFESIDDEHMEEIDEAMEFNLPTYEEQFEAEQRIREKEAAEANLPRVAMRTTQGDVVIELFLDQAPSTVSHFIGLVEQGFYEENDFYQVIDHLLALTGDPTGLGSGDCGKFLIDEHDREDSRHGLRGSLVMAKLPMGDTRKFIPNSASSQFAILLLPVTSISEQQTVFGRVIEGMDAISRLRRIDPSKKKKKGEIVLPPDRIIEMTVIRRPEELPEPNYVDLGQPSPN